MAKQRSIASWLTGHPVFGRTMGADRVPPRVALGEGTKLKIGKRAVRQDGTTHTVASLDQRRQERRGRNRAAKKARRHNRAR